MAPAFNSPRLTLFSTPGLQKALDGGLLQAYSAETGIQVDAKFEPTALLVERIAAGECPDVLIGVTKDVECVILAGTTDQTSVAPIAKAGLGIAIHPDQEMPDISTTRSLTETLKSARSVAYSRNGISGTIFLGLLNDLGIADQLTRKATVIDSGFTALAVLDGRADVAVQLVSELLCVEEAKFVGELPQGAQRYIEFSAVICAPLADTTGARLLVDFLGSDSANYQYITAGLQAPD